MIFVPLDFAAIILYLLYIDLATGGHWFLTFAFPVAGSIGVLITTVVALLRYVRRGYLYIFGGALIAAGGLAMLLEFLLNLTFGVHQTFFWSFYPLAAGVLLGVMLIIIAVFTGSSSCEFPTAGPLDIKPSFPWGGGLFRLTSRRRFRIMGHNEIAQNAASPETERAAGRPVPVSGGNRPFS